MTGFRAGDRVVKNPATWVPNAFDSWGRGVGVGVVVEPPFALGPDEADVRWPGGRCFEWAVELLPAPAEPPSAEPPDRPNILGCAGGFGAAGAGIGTLLGSWCGSGMFRQALNSPMPPDEKVAFEKASLAFVYGSLFTGILLGFLFGALTGVVYAVYTRRWLAVVHSEPLTSDPAPASPLS